MKRLIIWIGFLLISILGLTMLFLALGYRINITNSIPVGLYRLSKNTTFKNSFVIFCPDKRSAFKQGFSRGYISYGLCPGGYGYLMKKVIAVKGDRVSVTTKGVFVNHQYIAFSKPQVVDGMQRQLPQWRVNDYLLKANELMTMTNQSKWSFDGRYYGPIQIGQIKGVITPIWVYANKETIHA